MLSRKIKKKKNPDLYWIHIFNKWFVLFIAGIFVCHYICSWSLLRSPKWKIEAFVRLFRSNGNAANRANCTCSQWISELVVCWANIWHSMYTLCLVNIYLSVFTPCNRCGNGSDCHPTDYEYQTINAELFSVVKKWSKNNERTKYGSQMSGELEQIRIKLASNKYWQSGIIRLIWKTFERESNMKWKKWMHCKNAIQTNRDKNSKINWKIWNEIKWQTLSSNKWWWMWGGKKFIRIRAEEQS